MVKEYDEPKKPIAGGPSFGQISLIGGVDISFVKENPNMACVCIVVLSFPELEVVFERFCQTTMELPYIPSNLEFGSPISPNLPLKQRI